MARPAGGLAVRTLAAWLGVITVVNSISGLRGFDENLWWIDLRALPEPVAFALLVASGVLLAAWGLKPASSTWRRRALGAALVLLSLAALSNCVGFYSAWSDGTISPAVPVPFSLFVLLALGLIAWVASRPASPPLSRSVAAMVVLASSALVVVGFPIAQLLFFGTTTYTASADAIVVPGAKVHAGGVPSLSLSDRMGTAIDLYERGRAGILIVSGALEPSGEDETAVMRHMAEEAGVPSDAIIEDPHGVNTQATVGGSLQILRDRGLDRLIVVSHFYHLPRIELAYQQAGIDVVTVPSKNSPIPQLPMIVAREVPAFWAYYLRGLTA